MDRRTEGALSREPLAASMIALFRASVALPDTMRTLNSFVRRGSAWRSARLSVSFDPENVGPRIRIVGLGPSGRERFAGQLAAAGHQPDGVGHRANVNTGGGILVHQQQH